MVRRPGTCPDRKTGATIGVWSGRVDEQDVPYLVPQDYGNKCDVRWASVAARHGVGLFVAGAAPLNVSVQTYSTDNLTRALDRHQLVRQQGVTLNVDPFVTGVGGTPVSTLRQYRVLPQEYSYTPRFKPYRTERTSPAELWGQAIPRECREAPLD